MSFYVSLSGLKAAQTDLSLTANNVANVASTGFKKSKAAFGDIFALAGPTATGQGVRTQKVGQQFTQGTFEPTDKTLDLAISGDGFFTVKSAGPDSMVSYTRNGAFGMDKDRFVVDSIGSRMQVLPTDATGHPTGTSAADLTDLQIPELSTPVPPATASALASISISETGLVSATYADGSVANLGVVAMASFPAPDGLRQEGDAHWTTTGTSGTPKYGEGNSGPFGSVQSGMLERSNVDITEELVALISAQRNFQANSKAIETASEMTQTIVNLRT